MTPNCAPDSLIQSQNKTVMRIGVLGLGTIATAVVEGIAGDGHDITVSTRSQTNSSRLAHQFESVAVADNQAVVDASDIVFLGLTADAAPNVLETLRFREGQQVVSLMADLSLEATARLVAPADMAARMIPFPSIATGTSPILAYGDRVLVERLFGARNSIFALDSEDDLAIYLCAQAVLSPAVAMVKDAADWLVDQGSHDAEIAEAFLRTLVGSSLLGSPCSELLRALDTPGGYNQRMRKHMLSSGLSENLRDGLDRLHRG